MLHLPPRASSGGMAEQKRTRLAALVDDLNQAADVIAVRVRHEKGVDFANFVAQLLRDAIAGVDEQFQSLNHSQVEKRGDECIAS